MNTIILFSLISVILSSNSLYSGERLKDPENHDTYAKIQSVFLLQNDSIKRSSRRPKVNAFDGHRKQLDILVSRNRRNVEDQALTNHDTRSHHNRRSLQQEIKGPSVEYDYDSKGQTVRRSISSEPLSSINTGKHSVRIRSYQSGTSVGTRSTSSTGRRRRKRIRRPLNGASPGSSPTGLRRKRIKRPRTGTISGISSTASGGTSLQRPKNCQKPPHIPHGHVTTSVDYSHGSKIVYSCREGYRLEGIAAHICRSDGKWSAGKPACVNNDTLESEGDLKQQFDRITGDLNDVGETSMGKALMLGVVTAVIALLLLTCHCIRVSSTRRRLQDKHKEVIDEGLVPSEDVPGMVQVSNALLKKCFCCDSGLPTTFRPRPSRSRLSTTSLRDGEDGQFMKGSNTSIRRSIHGSLHRLGSKTSSAMQRRSYDSLIDADGVEVDFSEYPEGTDYDIPGAELSRKTSSRNKSLNGVHFDAVKHYRNDNASLKTRSQHRPGKHRINESSRQVRYDTALPHYYREGIAELAGNRKISRSRKLSRQCQTTKGRERSSVPIIQQRPSRIDRKERIKCKTGAKPTKHPYRNRNMNTNTEEIAYTTRLPLYNASQSSLTYNDYLENAYKNRTINEDRLLTDDDILKQAQYYNLVPTDVDFCSRNRTGILKDTTDNGVDDWGRYMSFEPVLIDSYDTAERDETVTVNTSSNTQEDVTHTDDQGGYNYGIMTTTINLRDSKSEELARRQPHEKPDAQSVQLYASSNCTSNTSQLYDISRGEQSNADRNINRNNTGYKLVCSDDDQMNDLIDFKTNASPCGIKQSSKHSGKSNEYDLPNFKTELEKINYVLGEEDPNVITYSKLTEDIFNEHSNDLLHSFKTEIDKVRYVLGEEFSETIHDAEEMLAKADLQEGLPCDNCEEVPHGDLSSDSSKTLVATIE